MARLDPRELQRTLKEVNARWEASDQVREYALGYAPGPTEHALATREVLAYTNHQHFLATAGIAPRRYPPAIDWRNVGGKNYVTPIRDQGGCGSCVSFGSIATVEAVERITRKKPALYIDLSEADLFFCHEGVPGGTCGTGWFVDDAMTVLQNPGVVDEKCFPYTPHDQPCRKCADWRKRLTKIKKWHKITAVNDMKVWLAKHGPLTTCFSVYADFYSYKTGVYHHLSGPLEGGHCVCCIGYNESGRYWTCKNSWGTGWGEQGFFRIAYGQVGIDALMWAVEA